MSVIAPSSVPMRYLLQRSTTASDTDESPLSSNLTTPVDELALPFDTTLIQSALNISPSEEEFQLVDSTPRPSSHQIGGKFVAETPTKPKTPRTLSKGFMKAKQFAKNIGKGSLGRSAKKSNVRAFLLPKGERPGSQVDKRIFSLPNRSIEDDAEERPPVAQKEEVVQAVVDLEPAGDEGIEDAELLVVEPPVNAQASLDVLSHSVTPAPFIPAALDVQNPLLVILKVLFFLPWIVSVGGCILLSPSSLDLIAFKPGYLTAPNGIHRFAHWADVAKQHVAVFFAFIFALGYWNKGVGVTATTAVLAGAVNAWWDFKVDLTVPLGENDKQSLWLVLWGGGIEEEGVCVRGLLGEKIAVKFDEDETVPVKG